MNSTFQVLVKLALSSEPSGTSLFSYRQMYYAPQVRPDRGSKPWPLDYGQDSSGTCMWHRLTELNLCCSSEWFQAFVHLTIVLWTNNTEVSSIYRSAYKLLDLDNVQGFHATMKAQRIGNPLSSHSGLLACHAVIKVTQIIQSTLNSSPYVWPLTKISSLSVKVPTAPVWHVPDHFPHRGPHYCFFCTWCLYWTFVDCFHTLNDFHLI